MRSQCVAYISISIRTIQVKKYACAKAVYVGINSTAEASNVR